MTEQPSPYQTQRHLILQAQQERDRLLVECQRLLLQVSKRLNSLKLLLGVKSQLELFSQYKRKENHRL